MFKKVRAVGFEPTRISATGLKSVSLNHSDMLVICGRNASTTSLISRPYSLLHTYSSTIFFKLYRWRTYSITNPHRFIPTTSTDPNESEPPAFPFADPKDSKKFLSLKTEREKRPRRNYPRKKWTAFASASLFLVCFVIVKSAYINLLQEDDASYSL